MKDSCIGAADHDTALSAAVDKSDGVNLIVPSIAPPASAAPAASSERYAKGEFLQAFCFHLVSYVPPDEGIPTVFVALFL